MRRVALFGLAAAVLAAVLPSAAIAATTCRASTAKGAKLVVASRAAVVYRRVETGPGVVGDRPIYYGCLYARDKPRQLNVFHDFNDYFGPWALAGRYVAFAYDIEEAAGAEANDEIKVRDLKTGRWLPGSFGTEGSAVGEASVAALVLKPNGSVAWIASYYKDSVRRFQVWALEKASDGEKRKLDEGKAVRPRSLALSANGKTVYWRNGGETRSEALH
jgi:hypothetical protein